MLLLQLQLLLLLPKVNEWDGTTLCPGGGSTITTAGLLEPHTTLLEAGEVPNDCVADISDKRAAYFCGLEIAT